MYIGLIKNIYVFSGHLALFYVPYMQHICYFTWVNLIEGGAWGEARSV